MFVFHSFSLYLYPIVTLSLFQCWGTNVAGGGRRTRGETSSCSQFVPPLPSNTVLQHHQWKRLSLFYLFYWAHLILFTITPFYYFRWVFKQTGSVFALSCCHKFHFEIKIIVCCVFCSGTVARRTKATVKMEDEPRHSKCGQKHHCQVTLQSHQE